MKRTKNMFYKESVESRELMLYATNDGDLYGRYICPVIENLKRKYKKGIYNSEKAVDAYFPIATEASNKYYKDFGFRFTVQQRFTVATEMEAYYREIIEFETTEHQTNSCCGNYKQLIRPQAFPGHFRGGWGNSK